MNIDRAIKLCKNIAKKSNMKYKIGAIIFNNTNNYILGYNRGLGCRNNYQTNPFSIHAEEMAILRGVREDFDFKNSTMVVVRINRSDNLRRSLPCDNCTKLIKKVEVKTIYYVE